jgi:uncharacterized protein (TIGR02452 family)
MRGSYVTESGVEHDISTSIAAAQSRTTSFHAAGYVPAKPKYAQVVTYVHNQTALTVAHARQRRGYRVAILNFADPTNLGSGWLQGRHSQEASLARASALVPCLQSHHWYHDPRHLTNPFYDDTVIVAPQVPVFRGHEGDLLDQPWLANMISAAPVHAHGVRKYMPMRAAEIPLHLARRATHIVNAAASTKSNVLVLGAWGCGRFGNSPDVIISAFQAAFESPSVRAFAIIDFAVPDVTLNTPLYHAFRQRFDAQTF